MMGADWPEQEEIARLELMHSVLSKVFDDRLIFPPVHAPERILDCGFGACDWAVDVAEHFPDSEVRLLLLESCRAALSLVATAGLRVLLPVA